MRYATCHASEILESLSYESMQFSRIKFLICTIGRGMFTYYDGTREQSPDIAESIQKVKGLP